MKAKRAKPARVYPAESDPRQVNGVSTPTDTRSVADWMVERDHIEPMKDRLAREFGPWVRDADGRWQRDRRKR